LATKPNTIKHPGVAVLVDEYQVKRVQTATVTADLATEDISELANTDFVESIADTPVITVTIDTNEYGHIDTLLALGNRSPGTSSGNVTLTDFENSAVDITIPVKENTALARTMHVGAARLASISLSYDVGGVAAENYSLEADNKTWFLNTNKEMHVASGTFASTSTFTSSLADTNNIAVRATVNEDQNVVVTDWTDSVVTITGVTLASADRIRLLYRPSGGQEAGFPALNTTGTGVGGIRKGQAEIFLYNASESVPTTRTLRVQTVSIDVDFGREALEELGNANIFERAVTTPISVDVGLSLLDTDLEVFAELVGSGDAFAGSTVDDFDVTSFITNAVLVVDIYDNATTKNASTLLKKVTVTGMSITNESHSTSIGTRSTQDFTLKASNLSISGTGLLKN
jgi:hypothetical protein